MKPAPRKKQWKAWAIWFRDEQDYWPIGRAPTTFEYRKEARQIIDEMDWPDAVPVRVTITLDKP